MSRIPFRVRAGLALALALALALGASAACGAGEGPGPSRVASPDPSSDPSPEPSPGSAPTLASAERAEAPPGSLPFVRAVLWSPDREDATALDPFLAPLLYMEAPAAPADSQGAAAGLGRPRWDEENERFELDADAPAVFFEEATLAHAGRDHRQLSFFWFRSDPEGRPLAQGIRTTFATDGWPAVVEVLADPSGERQVYLTESQEAAAREHFGAPLAGRKHAAAGTPVPGRRLVEIMGTGAMPMGPFVYETLRGDGIPLVHCRCSPSQVTEVLRTEAFALLPLRDLEHPGQLGDPRTTLGLDFGPPAAALEGLRLPAGF